MQAILLIQDVLATRDNLEVNELATSLGKGVNGFNSNVSDVTSHISRASIFPVFAIKGKDLVRFV